MRSLKNQFKFTILERFVFLIIIFENDDRNDNDDDDDNDEDDDNDDLKPLDTSKRALNTNPPFFWDTLYVGQSSYLIYLI